MGVLRIFETVYFKVIVSQPITRKTLSSIHIIPVPSHQVPPGCEEELPNKHPVPASRDELTL
jgi:hypothetical protein